MYQPLSQFLNLLLLHKSNSTFTLSPEGVGSGKYSRLDIMPFLLIQPLKELS